MKIEDAKIVRDRKDSARENVVVYIAEIRQPGVEPVFAGSNRSQFSKMVEELLAGVQGPGVEIHVSVEGAKLLTPDTCKCSELTQHWTAEDKAALCGHVNGCPRFEENFAETDPNDCYRGCHACDGSKRCPCKGCHKPKVTASSVP
jgi:hypothetical protein